MKFQMPLEGLRVMEPEDSGLMKRKNTFCIFNTNKRNVYKVPIVVWFDRSGLVFTTPNRLYTYILSHYLYFIENVIGATDARILISFFATEML